MGKEPITPAVNREEFRQQAALAIFLQVAHITRPEKPGLLWSACKESVSAADLLIAALEGTEGGKP